MKRNGWSCVPVIWLQLHTIHCLRYPYTEDLAKELLMSRV